MDTNPMIQGSESLTDCLNGTLITMNGNEVILQNDMGNRRVDNAFLPSGYQPVGMKEYGGIIYVAAYNPITDKSQIGSFPSPERRIDTSTFEGIQFDFCQFFLNYYTEDEKKYLKSDSFLIPLTKDVNLHAGDKFSIYSSGLSQMRDQLTNYDNILPNDTVLARSPKNRRFTIQVGVLNSQNEFVDITKTLCRWTEDGTQIEHDSSCSDIYKFNHGYFISDQFQSDFGDTIENSKLIHKRQKMAANTYSYKLVGPLYLKISLNHIQNFNYNIYGLYDKDGEATLWVEGFLTYNCPDGSTTQSKGNSEYYTFDEGIPSFEGFIFENCENESGMIVNSGETPSIVNNSVYDSASNTYSVKIVKEYNISNISQDKTVLKYGIYIPCDTSGYKNCSNSDNIYLRGLSEESEIDLSLLGSGKVFIKGWRFYNNVSKDPEADSLGNTTLTYSINAYPKYGEKFTNLRFKFVNIVDDSDILWYPKEGGLDLYNGRNTVNINWERDYFQPRTAYKVFAYYDIIDNDSNIIEHDVEIGENEEIWFLTTELFNEFYSPSKGIENFCTVDIDNPENSVEEEFAKKLLVDLKGNSKILDLTQKGDTIYNGSLVSRKPMEVDKGNSHLKQANITYTSTVPYNVKFQAESYFSIFNEELYPKYIKVNETNKDKISISEVKCKVNGYDEECEANTGSVGQYNIDDYVKKIANKITGKNTVEVPGGGNLDFDSRPLFEQTLGIQQKSSIGLQTVEGTAKCNNYYYGYNDKPITEAYNVFDCLSNVINGDMMNFFKYCGIIIDFWNRGEGKGDHHYIDVAPATIEGNKQYDYIKNVGGDNDAIVKGGIRVYNEHGDDIKTVSFSSIKDNINIAFNRLVYKGQFFTYAFSPVVGLNKHLEHTDNNTQCKGENIRSTFTTDATEPSDSELVKKLDSKNFEFGYLTARLWWRTKEDTWALFKELIKKGENYNDGKENLSLSDFIKFVKNNLKYDYIYCVYDYYTFENSKIKFYTANNQDFKYYHYYSFPITYVFKYKLYEEKDNDGQIIISYKVKDLIDGTDSNLQYGNLIFKTGKVSLDSSEITRQMESSQDFSRIVENFDPSYISNIELSTGLMWDSDGKTLDPNYVYYCNKDLTGYPTVDDDQQGRSQRPLKPFDERFEKARMRIVAPSDEEGGGASGGSSGESSGTSSGENSGGSSSSSNSSDDPNNKICILNKVKNQYLYIDRENKIDSRINTLVYNRYIEGVPAYTYDWVWDVSSNKVDGRTFLNYNGVNIVDGV